MQKILLVVVAVILLLTGAFVYSQQKPAPPGGRVEFAQNDDPGQSDKPGPPEARPERGPRQGDGPPREGRRGGDRPRFGHPLMELFDTDKDGTISKEEIEAASEVLSKLDKNEDGSISREEVPSPFPRSDQGRFGRGPGGPDGPGFGRGGEGGPQGFGRGGDGGPQGFGRGRGGDQEGRGRFDRRRGEQGENGRGFGPGPQEGPGFGPGQGFGRNQQFGPNRGPGRDGNGPPRPGSEEVEEVPQDAASGTVFFLKGHETNPVDRGRPVVLIASALGVEEQVFRDAFKNVKPSQDGPPSDSRAQANKKVLMDALEPHGVTNDRLDEVSNFYRYRPQSGSLWNHQAAKAEAKIEDGKVVELKVIDGGYGYSSTPEIVIAGFPDLKIEATVEFTQDLQTNGRITELKIVE
ncbi:MAG: EF-hand domain-containing protein [Planctomycetaceae bacterium]